MFINSPTKQWTDMLFEFSNLENLMYHKIIKSFLLTCFYYIMNKRWHLSVTINLTITLGENKKYISISIHLLDNTYQGLSLQPGMKPNIWKSPHHITTRDFNPFGIDHSAVSGICFFIWRHNCPTIIAFQYYEVTNWWLVIDWSEWLCRQINDEFW